MEMVTDHPECDWDLILRTKSGVSTCKQTESGQFDALLNRRDLHLDTRLEKWVHSQGPFGLFEAML